MDSFFGPGGCFQAYDDTFTYRRGQLDMSKLVNQAIQACSHVAIEGGTGVGKSLAYLVPAVQAASQNQKKIVISTWSISLQQQLIEKDLPWIEKQIGQDVKWVLAKGRGNYLSKRRYRVYLETAPQLFEQIPYAHELSRWVQESQDGSLSDWPTVMDADVWEEIVSDRDNCLARQCDQYQSCFFYKARRELEDAQIIIVNHALYFSHLALGADGFLPPHDVVIFDEAHQIEKVASEHLGSHLTQNDLKRLCDRLAGRHRRGGLLNRYGLKGHDLVDDIRLLSKKLFGDLKGFMKDKEFLRLTQAPEVFNFLNGPLSELATFLNDAMQHVDEQAAHELKSQIRKVRVVQNTINHFLSVSDPEFVYWLEGKRSLKMVSAPKNVGHLLKQHLYSNEDFTCIFTSATLSQAGNFDYFRDRLGFDGQCQVVSSPFDYRQQMDLIFDHRLLDPKGDNYVETLSKLLKEHILNSSPGGIFILFTSHHVLSAVAQKLESFLKSLDRKFLMQTREGSSHHLIEKFKEEGNAILFGTDRFWMGIDIPGETLQTVMITKLPFQYPDHPLNQSRCEQIEIEGGSSFKDFILPEAILKLRQGLGRLIRKQTDTGRVVILDGRVLTKSYGSVIRQSMPHRGRLLDRQGEVRKDKVDNNDSF